MGAFFGALSALSIGFTDLFGRHVVNRRGANIAALIIQCVAALVSFALVFVIAGEFVTRDVLIGAISGIGLGTGLACYLGGLSRSSSAVMAPIVATLSAVIPFGYAIARGAETSPWAVVGAIVAIGGLILITAGRERTANVGAGVTWALISGLGYGFGLSVAIEVTDASGAWPAVSQRVVAFALMTVVVLRSKQTPSVAGVWSFGLAAGVFASLATIFYLLGVQRDATPAVVMASMFPAATVAVGRLIYGDSVSKQQIYGLGVVLIGVAAVVAG